MKKLCCVAVLMFISSQQSFAQWNASGGTVTGPISYNGGNVGIGATDPAARLSLKTNSTTQGFIISNCDVTGIQSHFGMTTSDKSKLGLASESYLNAYNDGKWNFNSGNTSGSTLPISFNTNGISRLFIKAGGNVGVGTSDPVALLHVGTSNLGWGKTVRMILEPPQHTGAGWEFSVRDDTQNSFLGIGYGTEQFTIHHEGNIGIGTTLPDFKLHIKDGSGGNQLKFQRGIGAAIITQDIDKSNLYIDAPAGLMLNYGGGNVGIGTQPSVSKLHIADGNGGEQLRLSRGSGVVRFAQDIDKDNLYLVNRDASQTYMFWNSNGNVGIGTNNPTQKLTVQGTVYSTEVKVDVNAGTGPDYVFEPTYNLPTLAETEAYIKANKHLPEVPSAKEMEANGINLSEMNMLLLKKVEELTLHVIELKKRDEAQQKEIEKLKEGK